MKPIIFILICVSLLAAGTPVDSVAIGRLAFAIMFNRDLNRKQVDTLITLCRRQGANYNQPVPSKGSTVSALAVLDYPLSLERMQECMTTSNKAAIFKSAIYKYSRDLPTPDMDAFWKKPEGQLKFTSHHEVSGKFMTRFAYDMHTEITRTPRWIIERENTLPGPKQTRGVGGYIENISYFTILCPGAAGHTVRILGSWNDVGGDLPVAGKIKAKYSDIIEGVYVGDKDIREYFKIAK